jgi:hypothetical protein
MESVGIGREEGFSGRGFESDSERIFSGGCNDHIGMVFMDDCDTPKSLHEGKSLLSCGDDISLIKMSNELSDDFGIGIGGEFDVVGLEHLSKSAVIFNDPVMDDSDTEMFIKMGMGVFSRGFSMGCPAGMSNR